MFSDRLRALRKAHDLTQVQFAKEFLVASGTIAMWETGKREPDFSTMQRLADFFDVSVDYLLGRTDEAEYSSGYNDNWGESRNVRRIPIIGRVQAGIPVEAMEDFLGYEEFSGPSDS